MKTEGNWRYLRVAVYWLLAAVVLLLVVTGLGITQARVVASLTRGFLTKSFAFKVHGSLWLPFLVLMALHIVLSFRSRR